MIHISPGKSVYFASDQHFGAPTEKESKPREEKFIKWLDTIQPKCEALFLVGDLFDFWFEYDTVVPKGYVRLLAKLASFTDAGIPIYFFTGNHDLWVKEYFQQELGFTVFHHKHYFDIDGKTFLIAHGDGLGPGDKGYKRMKKVFTHPLSQWLFKWLHPDLGIRLGNYLSRKNKLISGDEDIKFLGEEKEWLVQYAKKKLETENIDYFIFGHRHLPMEITLESAVVLNLGDWIVHDTYAEFQNNTLHLKKYE